MSFSILLNLGRIKWARSLVYHLQDVLNGVTTHRVLKDLPATIELSKRHKLTEAILKQYEDDTVAIWMNQHVYLTEKFFTIINFL